MMNKAEAVSLTAWVLANLNLIIPLVLSLWMAWGDVKSRRIPNYLTFGTALAGLGFQAGMHGWSGLASGLGGLFLGFGLLIGFYILGGMGAGDVKALAALGAWLGPSKTLELFICMAIFGGILSIVLLWWRGHLWSTLRQGLVSLKNWFLSYVLLRPHRSLERQPARNPVSSPAGGIPYAVALAAGMATVLVRTVWPFGP